MYQGKEGDEKEHALGRLPGAHDPAPLCLEKNLLAGSIVHKVVYTLLPVLPVISSSRLHAHRLELREEFAKRLSDGQEEFRIIAENIIKQSGQPEAVRIHSELAVYVRYRWNGKNFRF